MPGSGVLKVDISDAAGRFDERLLMICNYDPDRDRALLLEVQRVLVLENVKRSLADGTADAAPLAVSLWTIE